VYICSYIISFKHIKFMKQNN